MTTSKLVARLQEKGVSLQVEGANLRYSAPKNALTDSLRSELIEHKAEIIEFLRGAQSVVDVKMRLPSMTNYRKFIAPQTPSEKKLAQIWSQVLGIEQIGINDNFFELGGDSLSAMQIVLRANPLGLPLTPVQLFDHQTIAELAPLIEKSITESSDSPWGNVVPLLPIHGLEPVKEIPLSYAQERLWFIDQLDPESSAYNLSFAIRMKGLLDSVVLERCLNEIVARHQILRSSFPSIEGRPKQKVAPAFFLSLKLINNLQDEPEDSRESKASRIIANEIKRPFNLSDGPLIRAALVKLSEHDHILSIVMHHIILDGWSEGIFYRELIKLYPAFISEKPSPLPDLAIQYADYAVWQRKWLQGEALESQIRYWKQQLHGIPQGVELPIAKPRPQLLSYKGKQLSFAFSAEFSEKLRRFSQQEGCTLYMILLAAFNVLLYRYTGQEDIVLGAPIAGRTNPELEKLIGFFVNTLVMRTQLSSTMTFRDLLNRVRKTALDAYAHQDLPFMKLVEELNPERVSNRNPLFQILFAFQNAPRTALEVSNLQISTWRGENTIAKFDLSLFFWNTPRGISGEFEYSTDLFEEGDIARMVGHLRVLLEGIVADPDQHLDELPILTDQERHRILVEWNETQGEYPREKCIHELFEEQVERTPDAVAVIYEDKQLTYGELNERANQLAHYLSKLGVGPEKLVGICVERSLEMVVGLLGILKAGGAYLPIDPIYPKERIQFMLEDSQIRVLLTQAHILEGQAGGEIRSVDLDTDLKAISSQSRDNLAGMANSEDLAYLIYTSGSTGQPKGVKISHQNVVNFLSSMQQMLELTRDDTFLSVTTLSFDIAGLEIYLPLITGVKVIVAKQEETIDGNQLLARLKQGEVSAMQATPASWQMLLLVGWEGTPGLKILCGGEQMSRELAQKLFVRGSGLWNMYGPTETTIWSTAYHVVAGDGPVSIGKPIANTQVYILDSHLQPVPIGVPSELYIGGAGLAQGYLNRAELTTEKFVSDPFSTVSDARIYRTGDLARWLPDGNIECLGRIDNQVKIRGFRIELGEIETALGQHPDVQRCVVVAREDTPGDKRLVAYIVLSQTTETIRTVELRDFLKDKLPEYMIPSFLVLDALPLTPNGKLDRKALPTLETINLERTESFVAPRTPIETELANMWEEKLGVKSVGVHDNFFELGGHSLLATSVIFFIHNRFGVRLPLRVIFDAPTIDGLAEQIETAQWVKQSRETLSQDSPDENDKYQVEDL